MKSNSRIVHATVRQLDRQGRRGPEQRSANTNVACRFETKVLTYLENLQRLVRLNPRWVQQEPTRAAYQQVIPV